MVDPAEALLGTIVADRYRLEALLGVGGMGAVYKATHVHMQKTVALKLLHPEMANVPEVLTRFEREAVAASSVTHPNLATALDFGKLPDNSFYLVMEFIPGELLRDALAAGAMPPERVARLGAQIAAALEAAHAAGIVHRDLKPENVMLRSLAGEQAQVKVLDLGIAKIALGEGQGTALTKAGAVLGTPQYMSPEQAIGGKVDHRADLYSLGVVLYEMASGAAPFPDDAGPHAVIACHLTQAPPPLPADVPAPLGSLILQLLEKSAAARPQTAAEVISRLRAAATAAALPPASPASPSEAAKTAVEPVVAATPRSGRARKPLAYAASALVLVVLGAWLAKTVASWESAEPETSPADVTSATATPAAAVAAGARTKPASDSEVRAPREAPPAKPLQPRSTQETKPQRKKGGKKDERKTGPGGIYVPPPEDWF